MFIHDGDSPMVIIRYCPWCGTALLRFAKRKGIDHSL